jgi:hypothetical protein
MPVHETCNERLAVGHGIDPLKTTMQLWTATVHAAVNLTPGSEGGSTDMAAIAISEIE